MELEDIVVIMDGSGSIHECEFQNAKNAAKGLMLFEQPGFDARYAAVTFASQVRRDFEFLPQLKAAAKIGDVKFPGGWTNTQAGLAEAFELFSSGKPKGALYLEKLFHDVAVVTSTNLLLLFLQPSNYCSLLWPFVLLNPVVDVLVFNKLVT